jgi:phosphoribosylglycinamide formyltransferase-1
MMRVGVLASGTGSNFQALVQALTKDEDAAAKVAVLISNVADAPALQKARLLDVPAVVLEHGHWPTRDAFDAAVADELNRHQVELVVLAGYMRLLSKTFLRAFPQRIVNVHPALLPSFTGTNAVKQALDYGVKVTGCTVHFVDEGVDTGPIIAQAAVPVLETDDVESLSKRIHAEEHRLLPRAVDLIARGQVLLEGRSVRILEPFATA